MIYPYHCECGHDFEVYKPVGDIENQEMCPKCNAVAMRVIARKGHFYGAKVEDAEYCPAMGCVVKNQKHRRQLARDRGMVEVGNDSGEYFKRMERDKQKETEKFYDEVARGI